MVLGDTVGIGMKKTILWTNPSPSSSFGAQTVACDYSGFDFILVRFRTTGNATGNPPVWVLQTAQNGEDVTSWSYVDGVVRKRSGQIVATGVRFEQGVQGDYNNNILVPLNIYGIHF